MHARSSEWMFSALSRRARRKIVVVPLANERPPPVPKAVFIAVHENSAPSPAVNVQGHEPWGKDTGLAGRSLDSPRDHQWSFRSIRSCHRDKTTDRIGQQTIGKNRGRATDQNTKRGTSIDTGVFHRDPRGNGHQDRVIFNFAAVSSNTYSHVSLGLKVLPRKSVIVARWGMVVFLDGPRESIKPDNSTLRTRERD